MWGKWGGDGDGVVMIFMMMVMATGRKEISVLRRRWRRLSVRLRGLFGGQGREREELCGVGDWSAEGELGMERGLLGRRGGGKALSGEIELGGDAGSSDTAESNE